MKQIQYLFLILFITLIVGCATTPPFKAYPGISFQELDSLAADNFCLWQCTGPKNKYKSGLVYVQQYDKGSDIYIYETVRQYLRRANRYPLEPNENYVGYFYFRKGYLVSSQEINQLEAEFRSKQAVERAAQEKANREYQEKQRIEAEKKRREEQEQERKYKAEQDRKKKEFEQCLNKDSVGMCWLTSSGFYSDKMIPSFTVKNNLNFPIKDIQFNCYQMGPSGTKIQSNDFTIYQIWNVGQKRDVSFSFYKHNQHDSWNCLVSNWSRY
ncbi:MAG: cell envelope integrity protein TolA [Betaproteobacteria bacterium]|jgi:hypothetical protein